MCYIDLFCSFWGKFGQRPNLKQSVYVYNQADFFQLIMDSSKNVSDFHIINNNTCVIEYDYTDEEVPDSPTGNVVIAAFTTCWARLRLLEVLHTVNERCLYYDTDSIIYVDTDINPCNVPLGDYLGQLTDELDGEHIVHFISGGPKNYAYITNSGKETCKVRGFTLNHMNAERINFDAMKDLVTSRSGDKISLQPQVKITRDKKRRLIINQDQKKDYRMVYTKRQILPSLDTLPYGY